MPRFVLFIISYLTSEVFLPFHGPRNRRWETLLNTLANMLVVENYSQKSGTVGIWKEIDISR